MTTANLRLHTGAKAVSRERVFAARTPKRTASCVPIPHAALLIQVEEALARNGFHVACESHKLTKNGNNHFGLLQVAKGHDSREFALVVGVRNAHGSPAALYFGTQIFCCDNLSFSDGFQLARQHTVRTRNDLRRLLSRAVAALNHARETQARRFAAYKATKLSEAGLNDLIVRIRDTRIVPIRKIPDVLKGWRDPRHDEFAKSHNVWRLFNGVTEVLKHNLDALPLRTMTLCRLLDTACGLKIHSAKIKPAEDPRRTKWRLQVESNWRPIMTSHPSPTEVVEMTATDGTLLQVNVPTVPLTPPTARAEKIFEDYKNKQNWRTVWGPYSTSNAKIAKEVAWCLDWYLGGHEIGKIELPGHPAQTIHVLSSYGYYWYTHSEYLWNTDDESVLR